MLKLTHFEGLDNLRKQLFLLVAHSALKEAFPGNYSTNLISEWRIIHMRLSSTISLMLLSTLLLISLRSG